MARCKECSHYAVCGKQRFLVQVDTHTYDKYNAVENVDKYCLEYMPAAGTPRAVIANEIFEEIRKALIHRLLDENDFSIEDFAGDLDEIFNKYKE